MPCAGGPSCRCGGICWRSCCPCWRGWAFGAGRRRRRICWRCGWAGRKNTFYLFGGKDEGSAALIQGLTLAGALLDEVALMPRSFVEQAAARCSVSGSRLWFSCNPESPAHWFYQEWILKAEEKGVLRIPFSMEDNPGLSPQMLERYRTMFQGTFYRRFVLGEWVAAEGLVYDFFDESFVRPPRRGWRSGISPATMAR
ncbi:MAG: terminase family protein [Lawsonibacter sp.]